MKTSTAGVDLITRFEGRRLQPYRDAKGYPTVGIGHLIQPHEDFSAGITEEQCDALLRADLADAEAAVTRLIKAPLTQSQFDALVSFTFNLGPRNLETSTLRRAVNHGDHLAVPAELLRWCKAGKRSLRGLLRRRIAEAALYLSD